METFHPRSNPALIFRPKTSSEVELMETFSNFDSEGSKSAPKTSSEVELMETVWLGSGFSRNRS